MQAVGQLNYHPNHSARMLALGKRVRVAVIYTNPSSAHLSEFLIGAFRAAETNSASLLVEGPLTQNEPLDVATISALLDRGIDAALLSAPASELDWLLGMLQRQKVPHATVGRGSPFERAPNVRINHFAAAKQAAEHLLGLGHKSIAFAQGGSRTSSSGLRLAGFCAAMLEAGLAPQSATIQTDASESCGGVVDSLFQGCRRPTAIIASCDEVAATLVGRAQELGIRIPEQVSVVCFDDGCGAQRIMAPLIVVKQPVARMASEALRLLVRSLEKHSPRSRSSRDIVLPFRIDQPELSCSSLVRPADKHLFRGLETGNEAFCVPQSCVRR